MGIAAGALVGGGFFLAVFGPQLLRPGNIGWLMRPDSQMYYLAFEHFRREPWQWPPGAIAGVGHPVGTSIGNSDAVPLAAFGLKAANAWLPAPFQFLGGWLFACFVLQGVFGALLARQVTGDRRLQALAATLFVLTPALVHRVGHPALCAHWTLLAALWLSLAGDTPAPGRRFAAWAALTAVTAAINPYLTLMVLGLALCAVTNGLGARRPALVRGAGQATALVGIAGAVFWAIGIFTVGGSALRFGGLGVYSMNLLSPVVSLGYSTLLPSIPVVQGGQAEGFIYFGAGWLLLVAVAAGLRARRGAAGPRLGAAWWALFAFTLLAVSPVVTAGPRVLADLSAWTPGVLDAVRSSGRFAWLPLYVAFALSLRLVLVHLRPAVAAGLLTAAVALQVADLQGAYAGLYRRERSAAWTEYTTPLASPVWDAAMAAHAHLVMAPPDMCASIWPDPAGPHLPFSMLAARHGATVNSGFSGRFDIEQVHAYCRSLQGDLRAGRFDDTALYVLSPAERETIARQGHGASLQCTTLDGFTACATQAGVRGWRTAAETAGLGLAAPGVTTP